MSTLTDAEHRAVDLAGRLYNVLADEVIAHGPNRDSDLREAAAHIHGLQRMVMAQAAARAHPESYRLLGCTHTGGEPLP